jgi:CRP/FNR family transcriptional regulator/CRP/FNR family cyclic AMP-dependent transcriptional regulator
LARTALLRDLTDEDLGHIVGLAHRRTFRRGEVVFHQGDAGDALHIVETGRLKVIVYGESGSETVLSILGPGESFGELALIDGEPRSATVQALEPAQTVSVRRDEFLALLRTHPETNERLLVALVAKIRQLTDTVSDLAFLDLEGRLAKKLLELAALHGSETGGVAEIEVPLTQEDLAAMVGATRASVNKVLGWYEDRHLISRLGRRITLLDPERLRRRIS